MEGRQARRRPDALKWGAAARVAGAAAALVVVLLVIAQLVLPGIAADRLKSKLELHGVVQQVSVSAFPAIELLWHHSDSVTVRMSSYRDHVPSAPAPGSAGHTGTASSSPTTPAHSSAPHIGPAHRLANLLASTAHTDSLNASVTVLQTGRVVLDNVVLTKRGSELQASALLTQATELEVGEYVAVYDFGGGTFDTAVLQRVQDGFEVRGAGGDDALGGEDFDDALYEWLGSQLEPDRWEQLRTSREQKWRRANRELLREARRAKEHLSGNADAPIFVPPPVERDILVNRGQLQTLIEDRVRETVDELRFKIEAANIEPGQLAAIYLAGGSSAIPLVASLIAQEFEIVPRTLDDPKTVVARGAAVAASHGTVIPRPLPRPPSSFPPPDPRQRQVDTGARGGDAKPDLPAWPPPRKPLPNWPPPSPPRSH